MYEAISQIPIKDILDKLGIKRTTLGANCLGLWDRGGRLTDGRRANISKNYVHDFSGKERSAGQPFAFVKNYLNLSNKATFDWFRDKFGIASSSIHPSQKNTYKKKRTFSFSYHRNW